MYLALAGAASSALDLLSSLAPGKSGAAAKTKTGLTQNSTTSFGLTTPSSASQAPGSSSVGQSGALSPQTLSALIAAQDPSQASSSSATSKSGALKDMFNLLDSNGDGQISKSEFESNLGAGGTNTANADSVFGKLDANGDGSVSLDELSAALKGKGGGGHHHAHGAGGGKGGQDALLQALDGASSTSTTNSDGSTTTTMTYADGTTITMNSPTAASSNSSASNSASSSYNLVEKMIQKQADALSLSAKQSLFVRV